MDYPRYLTALFGALLVALTSGCFRTQFESGDFSCGPDCPPGFVCVNGSCVLEGEQVPGPDVDAAAIDAREPDPDIDAGPDSGPVDPFAGRVQNPLVLYVFDEGGGDMIRDRSGRTPAIDLEISNTTPVMWNNGAGTLTTLDLGPMSFATMIPPSDGVGVSTRIRTDIQAENELTLEAWVTPHAGAVSGPRRILTMSSSDAAQSFTLVQGGTNLVHERASFGMRLRSTELDIGARGSPALNTSDGTVNVNGLAHVVFTRRTDGTVTCYLNGTAVDTFRASQKNPDVSLTTRTGDFSTWDTDHMLGLANESVVANPGDEAKRFWIGTYHLVAVYNTALTREQVVQNCTVGPDPEIAPGSPIPCGSN